MTDRIASLRYFGRRDFRYRLSAWDAVSISASPETMVILGNDDQKALPHHDIHFLLCRGYGLKSRHVLLVEDEPLISLVVAEQLADLGYLVETAGSVSEAAHKFRQDPQRYRVVITDVGLPDGRGDGLIGQLRLIRPGMPVVVCSGMDRATLAAYIGVTGHIDILQKPFLGDELIGAIQNAEGSNAGH